MRDGGIARLTRRAFATGMTGSIALLGSGNAAATARNDNVDAQMRDAALRGLARAGDSGDPVLAARADATLASLERNDVEAALLIRIYRRFDVASTGYWHGTAPLNEAQDTKFALLHAALDACSKVRIRYHDLEGSVTERSILPLALVHPPQGVKLVAWCEMRRDFRQFFVRQIDEILVGQGNFRSERLRLLAQLVGSFATE